MKNVVGMFLALLIGAFPITASSAGNLDCTLSKVCKKKKGCPCLDAGTNLSCKVREGKQSCGKAISRLPKLKLTPLPELTDDEQDIPLATLCNEDKLRVNPIFKAYRAQQKKDGAGLCSQVQLKRYTEWNREIGNTLVKLMCGWEEIPEFRKVESLNDLSCTKKEVAKVAEIPLAPMPKLAVIVPPPQEKSHHFGVFGIVVGSIGVAMLGGGGIAGSLANSDAKSANAADVQLDVQDFNRQAESKAGTANVLFGIGGVLVAAGAAMAIIDWGLMSSSEDVKISVGPASANLTIRW